MHSNITQLDTDCNTTLPAFDIMHSQAHAHPYYNYGWVNILHGTAEDLYAECNTTRTESRRSAGSS